MNENWFEIFGNKLKDEEKAMSTANIMIVGKTGVGKSTLINNVFRERLVETGIGKPVTRHLNKITKQGMPLVLYDTKGLELDAVVQEEIKKEITEQIDSMALSNDKEDHIHVMWYCINSNSNRIEDYEIEWINEFSKRLQVILIMTQCMGTKHKAFESYIRNLNLPVVNVVPTLAEEMQISDEIKIPAFGLKNLVDVTLGCMDEAIQKAFINAQMVDLERKVEAARNAVIPFVSINFATGFTPIPFSDAPVLIASQLGMLARLSVIFGLNLDKAFFMAILSGISGVAGVTFAGKTFVANILKLFPGIGTVAGGMLSGGTAAILTAALGFAYVEVMGKIAERIYSGQKIDNTEVINLMKEEYLEQLKKGTSLISNWQS